MGLDWVVLAREEGDAEINPTEVIGAVRASRGDPDVVAALREIWAQQQSDDTFEEFLDHVVNQDPPPIVLPYGSDLSDAMPAVRAEAQYYGFRGKALEPSLSRVSAAAERDGEDFGWL